MKKLLTISAFVTLGLAATAQDEEAAIREGNKQYKQGQFDKALPEYQKVTQKNPKNVIAQYNTGNARFRSNKYDEAQKSYDDAIAATEDVKYKEKSFYNKGVSFSKQQKLDESIGAWKNALKLDPADEDARFNLQKALNEKRRKRTKTQNNNNSSKNNSNRSSNKNRRTSSSIKER